MCGSATLAIVVSTPCMIGVSMIEIVTAPRLIAGAWVSPLTARPTRFIGLALSYRPESALWAAANIQALGVPPTLRWRLSHL
jgi:hypothetical protein